MLFPARRSPFIPLILVLYFLDPTSALNKMRMRVCMRWLASVLVGLGGAFHEFTLATPFPHAETGGTQPTSG